MMHFDFDKQLYFNHELENFLNQNGNSKINKKFDEKRKIGENDSYICYLIRNDLFEEFVVYLNKANISPSSKIESSVFETNDLFLKSGFESPSLIEYAAFFGSIQIFNYLFMNKFDSKYITPLMVMCAFHSNNPEIINILEKYIIFPEMINEDASSAENTNSIKNIAKKYLNSMTKTFINDSIKFHHNVITNYFCSFYPPNEKILKLETILENYNFALIDFNSLTESDFYYLCEFNYDFLVEYFLTETNIDINQINPMHGKTPLCIAIEKKNYEIVKLMVSHRDVKCNSNNKVDEKNIQLLYSELNVAIDQGNCELVCLLLSSCKEIELNVINQKTIINERLDDGCTCVRMLTKEYSYQMTSLMIAVENNCPEMVKLLLSYGNIDINQLLESKYEDIIMSLYCNYVDVIDEKNVLHRAVEKKNIEIVKILLSCNTIDVNKLYIRKENGGTFRGTALHIAIENHDIEMIKLLLSCENINPNVFFSISKKSTMYHLYTDFVTKKEYESKNSALNIAVCYWDPTEIIKLLLSNNKIDINLLNVDETKIEEINENQEKTISIETKYTTALHSAVKNGNLQIVNLLLENQNININMKDEQNKTPFDYSKKQEINKLFNQKLKSLNK